MHSLTCFSEHRSFGLFKAGARGGWRIPERGSVLTELLGNNGSCVPSLKRLATMRELRGSTHLHSSTAPSIYHAEPPELVKIQGCSLIPHISKAALAYCTDVFFSPLLPTTHFLFAGFRLFGGALIYYTLFPNYRLKWHCLCTALMIQPSSYDAINCDSPKRSYNNNIMYLGRIGSPESHYQVAKDVKAVLFLYIVTLAQTQTTIPRHRRNI